MTNASARDPLVTGNLNSSVMSASAYASHGLNHADTTWLNQTSSNNLDHDQIPYMTYKSSLLASLKKQEAPLTDNFQEQIRKLPSNIREEIKDTQLTQLFDFYDAMMQESTLPFAQSPSITALTPKIGDKVSMLKNVRENLVTRY